MKYRRVLLAAVHAISIILGAHALREFILVDGPSGWTPDPGTLRYFTVDSNLLALLSSLLVLLSWRRAVRPAPHWLWVVRLMAASGLALTCGMVMAVLAPIRGYGYMLDGPDLHLHLICPLLHILSFVLLEGEAGVPLRRALWGLLLPTVYGVVYMVNVVALRRWSDFYFLNEGGRWLPNGLLALLAVAILSLALWAGNRRKAA